MAKTNLFLDCHKNILLWQSKSPPPEIRGGEDLLPIVFEQNHSHFWYLNGCGLAFGSAKSISTPDIVTQIIGYKNL